MPFTVKSTDWKELVRIEQSTISANLVLKLIGKNNEILWLKCAPGLARARFASETLERLGYAANERLIPRKDPELATVLKRIAEVKDQKTANLFNDTKYRNEDLLLMENVAGQTYRDYAGSQKDKGFSEHLRLLGEVSIQEDLARLIAADLLLGNFDRLGVGDVPGGDYWVQFHSGNFMIDLTAGARFLPIDNETLAPSVEHIDQSRPATTEDLYRVVINGGVLKTTTGLFSSPEQSNMALVLGPKADQAISALLVKMFAADFKDPRNSKQKQDVDGFARKIAPMVGQQVTNILAELKRPAGRQGLNDLMKAYQNVAGMNYDAFKVKCRFAELMLSAPQVDKAAVENRALAYGKYRDWKPRLNLLTTVPAYAIPAKSEVERKFEGPKGERQIGKKTKKLLRTRKFEEATLRTEYDQLLQILKQNQNKDHYIVKSMVLCVSELLLFDLEKRRNLLVEVEQWAGKGKGEWVPRYYCKAILKRKREIENTCSTFLTPIIELRARLVDLKDDSGLKERLSNAHLEYKRTMDRVLAAAHAFLL